MRLTALLKRIRTNTVENLANPDIGGISFDSRCTKPGDMFFAVAGVDVDGHEFIADAVSNGAAAVVGQRPDAALALSVPYIQVADSRTALALAAHEFYANPSNDFFVVGVTGTNGKTSTVLLAEAALKAGGWSSCVLTTLEYRVGDRVEAASRTTPDAVVIARTMRAAADLNCGAALIEMSSHALDQKRSDGIEFDAAVFTNLTQDHLDYHEDMEDYLDAKMKLFRQLDEPGRKAYEKVAILNVHDPASGQIADMTGAKIIRYGIEEACEVRAENVKVGRKSTTFDLAAFGERIRVRLNLTGRHNVLNALAASSVSLDRGVKIEQVAEGLESVASVAGRFETVDCGQPFQVVVDYAHTEDGLRNLLESARAFARGRIIVLFGCGGDRDRTKRPKMGRVAATMGDYAVVTSDNPRTEDPAAIVSEVEEGIVDAGQREGKDYEVVLDRRSGIDRAISMARPDDLVLIAGKGHETYQVFADETIDFDDRAVAREILKEKGW